MKALSMTQPWATLVAKGAKRFETRSWRTDYRGPLAIHAAKGANRGGKRAFLELCSLTPFREALADAGYRNPARELPRGQIIAVADLVGVLPTRGAIARFVIEGTDEEAFGDWSDGRFAWQFGEVRELAVPLFVTGQLGLWDVPEAIVKELAAA